MGNLLDWYASIKPEYAAQRSAAEAERLKLEELKRQQQEADAVRSTGVNYLSGYKSPEEIGATPQIQQRNLLGAAAIRGSETTPDGLNRRTSIGGNVFGYDAVPTPDLMNAAFPGQALARQEAAAFPKPDDIIMGKPGEVPLSKRTGRAIGPGVPEQFKPVNMRLPGTDKTALARTQRDFDALADAGYAKIGEDIPGPKKDDETFGEPQTVQGANGPQLVRFGNHGTIMPVKGFDPKNNSTERIPPGYRLAANGSDLEFIPGGPADPNMQSPTQKAQIGKIQSDSGVLLGSLDDYEKAITEATNSDFRSAFAGGTNEGGQRLKGAWTNAALMAKGQGLYELGVLSGPDMQVITGALKDPGSFQGQIADKKAYLEGIKQVRNLVNRRLTQYQKNLGGPSQRTASPATTPSNSGWSITPVP